MDSIRADQPGPAPSLPAAGDRARSAGRAPLIAAAAVAIAGVVAAAVLTFLYLGAARDRDAARASLRATSAQIVSTNAAGDRASNQLGTARAELTDAQLRNRYVAKTLGDFAALNSDFASWGKDCDNATYNADKCGNDEDAITADLQTAQSDAAAGQAPASLDAAKAQFGAAYTAAASDWQAWLDAPDSSSDQAFSKFFAAYLDVRRAAEAIAAAA